ncbi:MAG: CcoQ/FixQ family Cbb3-type cytochrome c oxidase assembly chaperone [Alphaproteobacteria bacterium]|nr:CcoQ/FixQ family Cbb3-type cytochrome c oxidase assembly chaperone [Alphaproteobacteria bacterium]
MIDWITHHAGVIGLLFFVVFFAAVVLWLIRPGAKEYYKEQGDIPLKEE